MWLKFLFLTLVCFVYGQNSNSEEENQSAEIELRCSIVGETCVAKKLEISTRKTHIIGVFSVDKTQSKSLSDIKVFHAYNPKLRYIPKNLGLNFVNLHTISITRSELCVLEFRDFRYMKKLKKLYLAENKIEKVTSCVFRYVDTIEIINLDGNMIKALDDDTFVNLPDLHEFSANRNQIEILESGLFRNNLNLKKISLNRNRIHIVEINFLRMLNLELIDMQRNPCTNLIFKTGDLLREFQNQTSGSCKGPEDS